MARKTIVIGSFVAIALVGSAALVLRGGQPVGAKKEPVQKIPLECIYGTNDQPGLRTVDKDIVKKAFEFADEVHASNVFLVRARSITSALDVTRIYFYGLGPLDQTIGSENKASPTEHWLVAYLGIAEKNPSSYLVQSVEIREKVIRFSYLRPEGRNGDEAKSWYCFWAPVGELPSGNYTLELFDVSSQRVTFMRLMEVQKG